MAKIGTYTIVGELGRGGMGVLYRGRDLAGREVAIKVLSVGAAGAGVRRERFRREAEALAKLKHPNIVRIHTVGEHEGQAYLVMDLVDGESLGARLRRREGGLDSRLAVKIAHKLGAALRHAHEQGLLHRDVKPDNVLLAGDEPRLTDFGLARDVEAQNQLTKTGTFMGTPGFCSPEQALGRLDAIGPATDVFGLGATLYAMLTGRPPYRGDSLVEVVASMHQDPEPPSEWKPGLDPALDEICLHCLHREPGDRYPTVGALVADLGRFLRGEPVGVSTSHREILVRRLLRRHGAAFGLGAVGLLAVGALAAVAAWAPASPLPSPRPTAVGGRTPRPPDDASEEAIERARSLVRVGDLDQAIAALEGVAEPPADLVWKLVTRLVERGLREDAAMERTFEVLQSAPFRGVIQEQEGLRSAREALARQIVAETCAWFPAGVLIPKEEQVNSSLIRVRVARCLLPADRELAYSEVATLLAVCTSAVQLTSTSDRQHVLDLPVALACAVVELAPSDPQACYEAVCLSLFSVGMENKASLFPAGRRLRELSTDPDRLLVVAILLLSAGDADEPAIEDEGFELAAELLSEGALEAVQRGHLLEKRADALAGRGRYREAMIDVREAVAADPFDPSNRVTLGKIHVRLGELEEAERVFCRVIQEEANGSGLAVRHAADQLWDMGGREKVPEVLRKAARQITKQGSSSYLEIWLLQGALLELDAGEAREALARLNRLSEILPGRGGEVLTVERVREVSQRVEFDTERAVAELEALLRRYKESL